MPEEKSIRMPVKMIAMDMDGTMLNSAGKITRRTLDALRKAMDRGIIVAVDSGRYPENALCEVTRAGLPLPVIGTNGAKCITAEGKKLTLHPITESAVAQVRGMLDAADCHYYMYGDDFLASSDSGDAHHSEVGMGEEITARFGFTFLHGRDEMKYAEGKPVLKFYIWGHPDLSGFAGTLSRLRGISLTRSAPTNMEISPAGVDKATGLEELAGMYGISLQDVMTFGDQDNDLPMLLRAGYGYAMANGDPEVISKVRYTARSNDEDGIARAVEEMLEKQR